MAVLDDSRRTLLLMPSQSSDLLNSYFHPVFRKPALAVAMIPIQNSGVHSLVQLEAFNLLMQTATKSP